jgi:hypothetical protein
MIRLRGARILFAKPVNTQLDREVFGILESEYFLTCSEEPDKSSPSIDTMSLILSSHLRLDLPNGLLPLNCHAFCMLPHFTHFDFIIVTEFVKGTDYGANPVQFSPAFGYFLSFQ